MTRWLIRIVLFLAGSAALLVVSLVALLARGPIDLDFLRPRLEGALSSPDGAFRVELATVVLAWDAEERQSEIRGTGVRLIGSVEQLTERWSAAGGYLDQLGDGQIRLLPGLNVQTSESGRTIRWAAVDLAEYRFTD